MKLLSLGRRTATGPDLSEHQQRLVWRVTALLLDYPTAETSALTDELAAAAGELPEPIRTHVTDFLRYFCETDATERATRYVETFDMRRRASLHLTYYAYGDTRKRGMALLRFKHAYRQADITIGENKLTAHTGEAVVMPANIPHAVEAVEDFKMILLVLFPPEAAQ